LDVCSALSRLGHGVRLRLCVAAVMCCALADCGLKDSFDAPKDSFGFPAPDAVESVRNADLTAHSAGASNAATSPAYSPRPIIVPGTESTPIVPSGGVNAGTDSAPTGSTAAAPGVTTGAGGVEFNFERADIQAVTKALLGDTLGLTYVIDPRVSGTVTISSVGPVARKDVLPIFEGVLRLSNAAVVSEGNTLKIMPLPEATGSGSVSLGAGEPGFGVSVIPLHYTSATSVAKTAESFLTRPGAIRADADRNIILVQGTSAERLSAIDVIRAFDAEWLRNQSVGVYPLKSTAPETMIQELDRIFETGESGQGHGVIQFQPISRLNAVLAVAKSPRLLERVTQWVQRLDRSNESSDELRTYRLRYADARQVAKILNDIFVGRSGAAGETPANQIAPGVAATQSRLDSLGGGNGFSAGNSNAIGSSGGISAGAQPGTSSTGGAPTGGPIASAFDAFSTRQGGQGGQGADSGGSTGALASGNLPRGLFQNVRITADVDNNEIVIYSNEGDYRTLERALRDLDRPQLQVAIDATVAEVTLTDALQYGVQQFLTSSDVGAAADKGSVGFFPAATATSSSTTSSTTSAAAATATQFLQRVLPGFNLLFGPEAQPRAIISALSTITEVKVLSSPSLVVSDNQPALLQVGNEIPISTSTTNVLTTSNTVVSTIEMVNTGVIMKVLPHIHADGTVKLEIEQEISNVVNPAQQTLTPTLSERRIHTTVSVTSGQTVLLGGLITEEDDATKNGLPGLNQIKYLGDLLGNTSKDKQRTEIIVFIRPEVIRSSVDAEAVSEEFRERLDSMRNPRPIKADTSAHH
jgi:general secretion pathway protein D